MPQAERALAIAREALRQIARDRAAARPTAYYRAKARFALDRIEEALANTSGPWDGGHHFQEEDGYPGSKRGAP